jgi:hypothetical protein
MIIRVLCHVCDVAIRYYYRTTVKYRKTAVHSRHRTVMSLDFWSTALLRYGQHPYGTVFCTAIAIYGTVESPSFVNNDHIFSRGVGICRTPEKALPMDAVKLAFCECESLMDV